MGKGERIGEGLLISTNTVPGIFISKKKKKKRVKVRKKCNTCTCWLTVLNNNTGLD